MASPGRDVKFSKDRVTGNRNFITKIWSANNFLKLNNCKINKLIKVENSIKLPVNQWIYNEFVITQNLVSKNSLENLDLTKHLGIFTNLFGILIVIGTLSF